MKAEDALDYADALRRQAPNVEDLGRRDVQDAIRFLVYRDWTGMASALGIDNELTSVEGRRVLTGLRKILTQ